MQPTIGAPILEAASRAFLISPEGDQIDLLELKVSKNVFIARQDDDTVSTRTAPMPVLDEVIEIPVKYDMSGMTDLGIFRRHEGETRFFTRLDARPAEPFDDATFYVEDDGVETIVYIYSRCFSLYTFVAQSVEPEPVKPEYSPEIITVASLTATGTDRMKLSWIKVKGANYYDVYFTKEGGEPVLLESVGGNRKSLTIKNLEKGTTYVAYVQPWKQVGGEKILLGNPSPVVYAVTNGSATEVNAKGVYVNSKRMTMMAGTEYTLNGYVKDGAKGKKLVEPWLRCASTAITLTWPRSPRTAATTPNNLWRACSPRKAIPSAGAATRMCGFEDAPLHQPGHALGKR